MTGNGKGIYLGVNLDVGNNENVEGSLFLDRIK